MFNCQYCDFGTFSKDIIDKHNKTIKHRRFISFIKI